MVLHCLSRQDCPNIFTIDSFMETLAMYKFIFLYSNLIEDNDNYPIQAKDFWEAAR